MPPNITIANDSLVIDWPAGHFSKYAPREPEVVDLSIPAEMVRSGQPLTIGRFAVKVDKGSVSLTGGLVDAADEQMISSTDAHTLTITLTGDTWRPSASAAR